MGGRGKARGYHRRSPRMNALSAPRWVGLLRGVFAACWTCVASATPDRSAGSRVAMDVEVPAGCPGEQHIGAELERLLAGSEIPAEPLAVRVRVRTVGQRHSLSLETYIDGEPLRRELEAQRCEDLTKPAALVLALAIDPEATGRALEQERPTAPQEQVAPVSPDASVARPYPRATLVPARQARLRARTRTRAGDAHAASDVSSQPEETAPRSQHGRLAFHAAGAALLDAGALPSPTVGPALAGGASVRSWRVELRGFILPSRRATLEGDRGGDIQLVAGGLGACYLPLQSRVELGGCLGAELGRITGTGRGVSEPKSGAATWMAAQARAFCGYRLSSTWVVFAAPELIRRIGNSAFEIDGLGTVHRPSAYAARFSAGAELRFR